MIITQPPGAKLPLAVYPSFASSSRNPFAHSDDRQAAASDEDFSYPPAQRRSIAESELPPAYRPPSSISSSKLPLRKRKLKRKFKIAIAVVFSIYVAACTIVVALLLVRLTYLSRSLIQGYERLTLDSSIPDWVLEASSSAAARATRS